MPVVRQLGRYAIAVALAAAITAASAHANEDAEATKGREQARPAPTTAWHLDKEKYSSPTGVRSEAGVGLSLGSHLMLQLNYARTASGPMMRYPNDNGVLARLRVGF